MTNNPPVSWSDFNRVIAALSARLSAIESLFGVGPHTLVAKDGKMAFCGGPGHCQACDTTPNEIRVGVFTWPRSRFIPDYDSEGAY